MNGENLTASFYAHEPARSSAAKLHRLGTASRGEGCFAA